MPRKRKGRPSFYADKNYKFQVDLTRLGRKHLDTAHRRTGRSRADIVEFLIRTYTRTVDFPDDFNVQ
jgi:hypothetical protein